MPSWAQRSRGLFAELGLSVPGGVFAELGLSVPEGLFAELGLSVPGGLENLRREKIL